MLLGLLTLQFKQQKGIFLVLEEPASAQLSPEGERQPAQARAGRARSSGTATPAVWTDKHRAEALQGASTSPTAPQVSFSPAQCQTPIPWVQHSGFSHGTAGEELTSITLKRGQAFPQPPVPPALPRGSPCIKRGWTQGAEGLSPPAFLAFNLSVCNDVKLGYRARQVEKDIPLLYRQEQRMGKGRTLGA